MGFMARWLEKRRLRKLDQINKEIEALKTEGPKYIEKREKARIGTFVRRDTSFGLMVILILCIIAIIGLSLFYRQKFSAVTERYNEKLKELELKNSELLNLTQEFNETSKKLKLKEKSESELGTQYTTLESENKDLQGEIETLNDKITDKDNEIASLKTQIKEKDDKIGAIEDCILDNKVNDKEDCI